MMRMVMDDKDAGADCLVNDADDDTFFQEHV